MPWTINAFLFPPEASSAAVSITTSVNWISNLIVSFTFLSIQRALMPAGAFWLFAGIAGVGWVFFTARLPETKGKTIEEVQAMFQHRPTASQ